MYMYMNVVMYMKALVKQPQKVTELLSNQGQGSQSLLCNKLSITKITASNTEGLNAVF